MVLPCIQTCCLCLKVSRSWSGQTPPSASTAIDPATRRCNRKEKCASLLREKEMLDSPSTTNLSSFKKIGLPWSSCLYNMQCIPICLGDVLSWALWRRMVFVLTWDSVPAHEAVKARQSNKPSGCTLHLSFLLLLHSALFLDLLLQSRSLSLLWRQFLATFCWKTLCIVSASAEN